VANSDTLWDVFRATGYIGAYMLYRETIKPEEGERGGSTHRIKGVAGI
jgi:hypothetical protein